MSGAAELWSSGLLWIAIGALFGLVVGLWSTRRDAGQVDPFSAFDDAAERQAHRVALLRDLEEQKGSLPAEVYAAQRQEYELLAAQALAEREKAQAKLAKHRPPSATGLWARHPQLRGLAWGAAAVATLWLIWTVLSRSATPPPPARTAAASSPELEEVGALLRRDPANLPALIRGGELLLRAGRFDDATPYLDRALQLDPEHPAALTNWAALRAARGDLDGAARILDRVVARHPNELEAWSLRGMVAMQRGDDTTAKASLTEFVARAPDGPEKEGVKALLNAPAPTLAADGGGVDAAALWQAKCASCHGDAGRGDPLAETRDLTAPAYQRQVDDAHLRESIRAGRGDEMPAFENLSAAELDALVRLLRAWGGR